MTTADQALALATQFHEGQTRKGSESPFIEHPIAVSRLVEQFGGSEAAVQAALLHDAIEDTHATYEALVAEVGERVADIVLQCTEQDKALSWKERKVGYLEHLRLADPDAAIVSLADKIHNVEATVAEYEVRGDDIWSMFNAGYEDQRWWYESLLDAFRALDLPADGVDRFQASVETLFPPTK